MIGRAFVVWVLILVGAVLNGALRDIVIAPRVGDTIARAISSVTLSAIIVVVAAVALRWLGPHSMRDAIRVGALWVALTIAFEFGAGHFVFGKPWSVLFADYDITRGRIWIVVLVTTLVAPALAFWRANGSSSIAAP